MGTHHTYDREEFVAPHWGHEYIDWDEVAASNGSHRFRIRRPLVPEEYLQPLYDEMDELRRRADLGAVVLRNVQLHGTVVDFHPTNIVLDTLARREGSREGAKRRLGKIVSHYEFMPSSPVDVRTNGVDIFGDYKKDPWVGIVLREVDLREDREGFLEPVRDALGLADTPEGDAWLHTTLSGDFRPHVSLFRIKSDKPQWVRDWLQRRAFNEVRELVPHTITLGEHALVPRVMS